MVPASKLESITVAGRCTSNVQRRLYHDVALWERIPKAEMKKNQGKPHVPCSGSEKQVASSPFTSDDCPFAPAKGKFRSRLDYVPSKLGLDKKNARKEFEQALDDAELKGSKSWKSFHDAPHFVRQIKNRQPKGKVPQNFPPLKNCVRRRLNCKCISRFDGRAVSSSLCRKLNFDDDVCSAPSAVMLTEESGMDMNAINSKRQSDSKGQTAVYKYLYGKQCSLEEASPVSFMKCVTVDSPPAFRGRIRKALHKTKSSSYSLCLQISLDFGNESYLLPPKSKEDAVECSEASSAFYKKQREAPLRKNTSGIRGLLPLKIVRKQKSTLRYMR